MPSLLEVQNISKRFSGVTALNRVNLSLTQGKVTALIGENGAGKSTLLKILSGIHTDYEGIIFLKGKPLKLPNPKVAQEKGISIIHQELNLIPHLSITQNIFLGRELTNVLGFLDMKKMEAQTLQLLQKLNLDLSPTLAVSNLKVGQQQIVEIAKALLVDTDVLFMDEPTSALGEEEVKILFDIIKQLKASGKSVVYISHKMEELFAIADDFIVLRDGEVMGTGNINDISKEHLIQMMAGRNLSLTQWSKEPPQNAVRLLVKNLNLKKTNKSQNLLLKDINFHLNKGEILGIYGLMGAGRTELCESLFGLNYTMLNGEIYVDEEKVDFKCPAEAAQCGIALVPEDRKNNGIISQLSVGQNLSLTCLKKLEKWGFISPKLQSEMYKKHKTSLNIKVQSEGQLIKNLSGGNQQKVVLAKWIECKPKVLLLDEPTRGIDINAKNEIYELIIQLANSGISIILASSEIPEILAIADRVLVLSEGQITESFNRSEITESKLVEAAISTPEN